jgi:hypothetical protein
MNAVRLEPAWIQKVAQLSGRTIFNIVTPV